MLLITKRARIIGRDHGRREHHRHDGLPISRNGETTAFLLVPGKTPLERDRDRAFNVSRAAGYRKL